MKQYGDLDLLHRLLGEARGHRLGMLGLVVVSLLAAPLTIAAPLPLKVVVDNFLGGQPLDPDLAAIVGGAGSALLLATAVGLLIALAALRQLQALTDWLLSTYLGERLTLAFRARLFRHAQRLSLAYHDQKGAMDAVYRIQYDASSVQHVLIDGLLPLIAAGLTIAGMLYVTALIDPLLAGVAVLIAPALFVLSRTYSRPLRRRWNRVAELRSSSLAVVQEVLGSLRVVKAFGQEEREETRFRTSARDALGAHLRVVAVESGFKIMAGLITALGTAAVLFIGAQQVQAGLMTLGELLIVMAYLVQLYEPLRTLSTKVADLQASLSGAERAFRLLDEAPSVIDLPSARPLVRARGAVEFQNVAFGYEPGRTVLIGISFRVQPGQRVAVAGRTGAGKTTLVSLLMRFYDPTAGRVLLDGDDLRDIRLEDLRAQFSIVLQEPVLFPVTIAENIAYARPGASLDEIVAAARAANADEFVRRLPEGYQTLVGERGQRLSGGERQRISLARAFLRDAPIMVLDEPTSSVDLATEKLIMDAMERLVEDRTTFIIAHRPSVLEGCDVVLRLERGMLVDEAQRPARPSRVGAFPAIPTVHRETT